MKKDNRKRVIGAVPLLILLLGACQQELSDPPQAATGKVTVSVALAGVEGLAPSVFVEARTVAPAAVDFTRYTLSFTPTSGGAAHEDVEVSGGSAEVSLEVGTYTITAKAFTGNASSYTEVAVGEKAGVNIQSGQTTEAGLITLGPKLGGANGTFGFKVTAPAEAVGSLTITTAAGGLVSGGTISLGAGTITATVGLAPGEYRLALDLLKGGEQATINSEAIYIYSGLTSTFEKEFTDADFTPAQSPGGTGSLGVTITFGVETIPVIGGVELSITQGGPSGTLALANNNTLFGNIKWYLDGAAAPTQAGPSYTLNPDNLSVKRHFVTVTAEKNNRTYSELVEFTVNPPVSREPVSAENLADLLATLPVGSAAYPTVVALESFDVSSDTWETTVKTALKGVEKYITLDLSACTAANNTISGTGGDYEYGNFNSIKSNYIVGLILPDTLTTIGKNACYEWKGLRSVTIPSGVKTIDASAFYYASNLTSITIPNTVTGIAAGAFWGTGLESVIIPASVQAISGVRSFCEAPLTSVTFLGNSTTITKSSFDGNFQEVYDAQTTKAGTYVRDGIEDTDLWSKQSEQ